MLKILSMLILFFSLTQNGLASELLKDISIYPLGGVSHFKPKPVTNETAKYFAISKTIKNDNGWQFENGIGTFKDSYHQRAYMVFSNISHENYRYGLFTPMLNLHCAYKGHTNLTIDVCSVFHLSSLELENQKACLSI